MRINFGNKVSKDYSNNFIDGSFQNGDYTFIAGLGFMPRTPRQTERINIRKQAFILGMMLLCLFAFFNMFYRISSLYTYFVGEFSNLTSRPEYMCYLFTICISYSIIFLMYIYLSKMPLGDAVPYAKTDLGMSTSACLILLGVSVIGYYAGNSISFILDLLGYSILSNSISLPSNSTNMFLYFIAYCVAPAFLEEILFRGAILHSLRPYGDGFSIIISSIFFALFHSNPVQIINAFLCGLVLGYFTVRTKNIILPICMHFLHNFTWTIFSILETTQPNFNIIFNVSLIFILVLAFISILFLIKKRTNMFTLMPSSSLLNHKTKIFTLLSSFPVVCSLVVMIYNIFTRIQKV